MLGERGRLVGWRVQWGGEWWRGQTGLAALREQHEQSAEVRPPGEKPAEVFLAEPSQG